MNSMKKAIVMGASSGIGRSVALMLLKEGWHVGVAARRAEALEEIRREFPGQVSTAVIDITEPCATQCLEDMISEMGGMDLYFHSSGYGRHNMSLDTAVEERTVMTNAIGFTRMVDTAYRHFMLSGKKGHIAVISSIAGTKGLRAAPSYSATKRFQWTYVEALEQQARMNGADITFTDIRPGFVDTDFIEGQKYPMLLDKDKVAKKIIAALKNRRRSVTIDFRYTILCFFWRLLPSWLWRRMRVC